MDDDDQKKITAKTEKKTQNGERICFCFNRIDE